MIKIYSARYVIPVTKPVIEDGAVVIKDEKIVETGAKDTIIKKYPSHEIHDLGFSAILPGLINPHVHLELTNLGPRTRIAKLSFPFWLLGIVVGTRIRTERFFKDSIYHGLQLVKESGTTTAGHIATFIRNPCGLFLEAGIRGIIFLEAIGLKESESGKIIEKLEKELKEINSTLTLGGLSPHAPYSVSESLFRKIAELSKSKNIPLSIHVAESMDEIKLFRSSKGRFKKIFYPLLGLKKYAPKVKNKTPVQFLYETGVLGPRVLAIHCVHLHENDIRILADNHVSVVHCPRSNYYLNVGEMPLRKLLENKINVCLGTDGLISNDSISMWDEARFLKSKNTWLDSESILKMMTWNSAKALNMEDKIGSLTPGCYADMISVDLDGLDKDNIYDFIITQTSPKKIKSVWVGGKKIYG